MIKVFFESKGSAELVAIFTDEETYMTCYPALSELAKESRMAVTESVFVGYCDSARRVEDITEIMELVR